MTLLAALAAAAALVPAADPFAAPGMTGDLQVTADTVSYDVGTGRVLLEGNAIIRRGPIVLRARSATWDPATGEVRGSGQVLLTDPTRVVSADAIRAVLGGELEAEGVLAFIKDRPTDLSGLRSAAEAGRAGRNRVTLSGGRLHGTPDGRMTLSGARLTLCDCPGGAPPSWELTAREADVIPGKRAILRWSVVRITPRFLFVNSLVPVLVVPWIYVPLGERQTGLLLPAVGSSGASGFSIAEPLFITLGRSADATLTPEYAFGGTSTNVAVGRVRGPGARLELRWAPAQAAEGRLDLAWLNDLDHEPGGAGGQRWALDALHGQRLGARTALEGALRLTGDPVWVRDTTADLLARSVPYRRSDLLLSHRRDAVVGEAWASYIQPLRPLGSVVTPVDAVVPLGTFPTGPYGALGSDVGVASRLGSAAATILPAAAGPFRLSARAGAARFSEPHGLRDVVGRPAVSRADARAEIAAPVVVAGALTVAPFVRGEALGYAFDGAQDPASSAWGIAGATVESEISRGFGAVRHAIVPRVEWRAGTRPVGNVGDGLPFPAYDALDRSTSQLAVVGTTRLSPGLSAAPGSFQQLRASVENRLQMRGATVARVEVGQDVDLRESRLAETFAVLAVGAGPVSADGRASFLGPDGRGVPAPEPRVPSPFLDRFTELRANVSVHDRRGDGVHAGFLSVGEGGSGTLGAGIDPLFDLRPVGIEASASATAGFRASLGGARLGYDALFPGRAAFVQACTGPQGSERRVSAFQVQQHAASLAWESSCHCFRILARASVTDCGEVSYRVTLDLTSLAGALTR